MPVIETILQDLPWIKFTGGRLIAPSNEDLNIVCSNIDTCQNNIICTLAAEKKLVLFAEIINQNSVDLKFEFNLSKNTQLQLVCFIKNCYSGNLKISIHLLEEFAAADIRNICITDTQNIINIQTLQDHHAPQSYSSTLNNMILDGESQIKIDGLIVVNKHSTNSTSLQQTNSTLLSNYAHTEVTPSLNILNNDITCKHGAAIGQLDPMNIYYMQSRGINKEALKTMLINGRILSTFEGLNDPFWTKIAKFYQKKQIFLS